MITGVLAAGAVSGATVRAPGRCCAPVFVPVAAAPAGVTDLLAGVAAPCWGAAVLVAGAAFVPCSVAGAVGCCTAWVWALVWPAAFWAACLAAPNCAVAA